jgi:hypothetical protein
MRRRCTRTADNRHDSRFTVGRLNLQYRSTLGSGLRLEANGGTSAARGESNSLRQEFDPAATLLRTVRDSSRTRDRTAALNGKLSKLLDGDHSLVTGAEIERLSRSELRSTEQDNQDPLADFEGDLQASSLRLALYAQDEWALRPELVGARRAALGVDPHTRRQRRRHAARQPQQRADAAAAHAVWKPDPKSRDQVRLSLTRSYKAPTLQNLVARPVLSSRYPAAGANTPTSPDRAGNPDLRPELATGIDLAFERYLPQGGVLSANLFHRRIKDYIRSTTEAGGGQLESGAGQEALRVAAQEPGPRAHAGHRAGSQVPARPAVRRRAAGRAAQQPEPVPLARGAGARPRQPAGRTAPGNGQPRCRLPLPRHAADAGRQPEPDARLPHAGVGHCRTARPVSSASSTPSRCGSSTPACSCACWRRTWPRPTTCRPTRSRPGPAHAGGVDHADAPPTGSCGWSSSCSGGVCCRLRRYRRRYGAHSRPSTTSHPCPGDRPPCSRPAASSPPPLPPWPPCPWPPVPRAPGRASRCASSCPLLPVAPPTSWRVRWRPNCRRPSASPSWWTTNPARGATPARPRWPRPNDGHTLLMGTVGTQAINASLYPKMPYDAVKDFAPVTLVAGVPNVLVINPASAQKYGVTNVIDFIKALRANPGQFNMASSGNGTSDPPGRRVVQDADQHLHGPPAVPRLGPGADRPDGRQCGRDVRQPAQRHAAHQEWPPQGAGRDQRPTLGRPARPAHRGRSRRPAARNYEASSWFGLLAPAGTAPDIVNRLQQETAKALALPAMKDRLQLQGAIPSGMAAGGLCQVHRRRGTKKWAQVVKASGAKVD